MYFSNLSKSIILTKSLKKKFAIIQSNKAPMEIENVEINVPAHFPNNIPDIKSIGVPKPKSITQNDENKKNRNRFNTKFFPINSSIFDCINLQYEKSFILEISNFENKKYKNEIKMNK